MLSQPAAMVFALAFLTQPLRAADLSIALSADVTSIDPHFHNLAGEVRAIENVPTTDLAKAVKNPDLSVYRIVSHRVMHVHLDSAREKSPFVTDKAGKPLERNPLRDQENVWAARKGIVYTPRADERTFAHPFRPQ